MRGGGGSGRKLTPQELSLIESQRDAFDEGRFRSSDIHNAQMAAFRQTRDATPDFLRELSGAESALGALARTSSLEGIRRQNDLRSILSGQGIDINRLREVGVDPNIEGALGFASALARNNASSRPDISANQGLLDLSSSLSGGGAGGSTFRDIISQALSGAESNPLDAFSGRLMDLSQLTPANESIQGLQELAGRAGQIGMTPGAAETVLTPGAIELLSQALTGETPAAIARLFQSDNTAARTSLENQFDAARQRLIDRGIRGGALERALAGLEGQRALGISSQEADLENQARNATLALLGEGTTFGLTQPFQREQLALQGIQAGGQLEGLAGNLGLSQGQLQGNLANLAGNLGAQGEQLRQSFLDIGLGAGQALSNEGLNIANLRGQLISDNIRNQLAAGAQHTANIGLAGQLGAQRIASQLGITGQEADILNAVMAARSGLAAQLGAGGDALRFTTSPALRTQGIQLGQLGVTSPGLALDMLTGGRAAGSGSVDLGSALAAASNAANFQGGPSRASTALTGGLSGAATGAMIGSVVPGIGTAIGAAAGGIIGLAGGALL